jgi:uncharacterized membrane protein
MKTGKLILYAVAGLLALLVAGFVIKTVLAIVSLALFALKALAVLGVLGGLGYAGYKTGLSGSDKGGTANRETSDGLSMPDIGTDGNHSTETGAAAGNDLQQQYLNGEISEKEFERRLEQQMDDEEYDSIDRELQRDRV